MKRLTRRLGQSFVVAGAAVAAFYVLRVGIDYAREL